MSTPHSKPSPKRAKPGFHKLNEIIRSMAAATEKKVRVTFYSWLYWCLQGTLTLNQCTFGLHYLCGFRFTEYFFQSNPTKLDATQLHERGSLLLSIEHLVAECPKVSPQIELRQNRNVSKEDASVLCCLWTARRNWPFLFKVYTFLDVATEPRQRSIHIAVT